MELMIPLDGHSGMPYYEQIYNYIREEIKRGNLKASMRLPSTRLLAEHLKVSRSTTQMAYEQLLSEGYIESVPCRGYFVLGIEELVDTGQDGGGDGTLFGRYPWEVPKKTNGANEDAELPDGAEGAEGQPGSCRGTGSFGGAGAFGGAGKNGGSRNCTVDFSPRGVDLESFPFNTWRKITRNTLVDDNREMFASGDPQGEPAFREAIRSYLHSARGVNCTADQIVVGAGSEYLLMLLSRILGPDHTIAMENPTYKQAYRVFESLLYSVVPVEMDGAGLDVNLLNESGADIAYVMPSHQYPTGIVMPVKRRQELLAWAYKGEGRYLIEDDYDSEFRYKGKPIPALQGMDSRERVIYSGTFSKSIAPAIRVSYLVLPKPLLAVYRERVSFYSSTVSRIDQNILYQFMTGGYYERHLNRMRAIYKAKHDTLLGALKPFEKQFKIKGEYAGLHLLLTDRLGRTEEWLVEAAKEAGVRVYGLSSYVIREGRAVTQPTVVLGYAMLSEDEIRKGIRLLKRAWSAEGEQEEWNEYES